MNSPNSRHQRFLVVFLTAWLVLFSWSQGMFAQDVLITKSSKTGKTVNNKGRIVDWQGDTITLATNTRDRQFNENDVVQVQTAWHASYIEGRDLVAERSFAAGIEKLNQALQAEPRSWAKRFIRARRVEAYTATGQIENAIRDFVAITQEDSQSRFFHLIPLAWVDSINAGNSLKLARGLIQSRDITARLIGASWMIGSQGEDRKQAIEELEKLAKDIDPNIANLAIAQLWRTQLVTARQNDINRWKRQIRTMPESIRGGPYYILGMTQSRMGQKKEACVQFMRLPILFPEQHTVVAAALYKCGNNLFSEGDQDQALTVWKELYRKYPGTLWAAQIKDKISN